MLSVLKLPLDLQIELFDSLVLPILLYGCEIWGFESSKILEKPHLKLKGSEQNQG